MEVNQNKRDFNRYIKDRETNNPFFHNYIFSKKDLKRVKISKWQRLCIYFLPTYIQLCDGYTVYYKLWQGQIFLIKMFPSYT